LSDDSQQERPLHARAHGIAALCLWLIAGQAKTPPATHTITVKFDYDFSKTPACTKKITRRCVDQFVVYDISAGVAQRTKLATIPLPDTKKGLVRGIEGTTPPLVFESGKHLIGVTAQGPNGFESDPRQITTWVEIP